MAFYRGVYEGGIAKDGKMIYEEPFAYNGLINYDGKLQNFRIFDSISWQEKNFSPSQIKYMDGDVGRFIIEMAPENASNDSVSLIHDYTGSLMLRPLAGIMEIDAAWAGKRPFPIKEIASIQKVTLDQKLRNLPQKKSFQKRL